MNAAPMTIKPKMAAIICQSTRAWRSFKWASNILLSARQGFRFWSLFAFLQGKINLLRDGRAGRAAGGAVLDHDDDRITRVLKGCEGGEPGCVAHDSVSLFDLCGARFGTDTHAGHERPGAGALRILDVSEHGVADDFEAAPADLEFVSNPAGRKIDGRGVAEGLLGFGPRDESGPKHLSAIGHRRNHDGDLERRDGNVSLADAKVGGVSVEPCAAPIC